MKPGTPRWACALAAAVMILAGCGGGGGGPLPGAVDLFNEGTYSIDRFFLAPVGASDWGPDFLTSPLAPGFVEEFPGLLPDSYNALAEVDAPPAAYYARFDNFSVAEGLTTQLHALDSLFTGSLSVTNNSPSAGITGLYVVPASSPGGWGPNQISSNILPGGNFLLNDLPPGSYGVRVTWTLGSDTTTSRTILSLTTNVLSVS